MSDQKQCNQCNEIKSLIDFYKNKSGYRSSCKKCVGKNNKKNKNVNRYRTNLLQLRYKLTLDQYKQMWIDQKGCCAICKRNQNEFVYALSVDHNHECCPGRKSCGKCIRGLLCQDCNLMIGNSNDNPQNLLNAFDYIKKYN